MALGRDFYVDCHDGYKNPKESLELSIIICTFATKKR